MIESFAIECAQEPAEFKRRAIEDYDLLQKNYTELKIHLEDIEEEIYHRDKFVQHAEGGINVPVGGNIDGIIK